MKPDWDKLMAEYKGAADRLIADVDCTAGGKSLCESVGVRGYPTIKHGDPNDLQDYKGGRSFADLKKFADGLGPQCGPGNLDLCDDAKKKQIAEFQALSASEREAKIGEQEKSLTTLESDFKKFVDGLQKQYTEANEKKDKDLEAIKSGGLGLLKSVHAFEKKAGKGEL
jgi:hypothetical protein